MCVCDCRQHSQHFVGWSKGFYAAVRDETNVFCLHMFKCHGMRNQYAPWLGRSYISNFAKV